MKMIRQLKDIGEFGFIKKISKDIDTGPSVVKGIGDDCAVIRYTKDKYLLFASDMIIEDVHFKREANPESIGHKALAVNISDMAACGGIGKYAVISIGVPKAIRCDYIDKIYKGIKALARKFKIDIVGGDTNLSNKIIISIALLGEVEKNSLILRSGAKNKDVIILSGGLCSNPDDLRFIPQVKEARYLVKNFKINSMIDISDGFLQDLSHILKASKRGAIIYESLAKETSFSKVLNTGEQFKLLFTMPKAQLEKLPKNFYPVGEITPEAETIIYITRNGIKKKITPKGYRHF